MSYKTRKDAIAVGKELCPKGWKIKVWDNIGWHVRWEHGPVSVYECSFGDSFLAFISPDPDACGSGGEWTTSRSGRTVLEAAAIEIAAFRRHVKKEQRLWAKIAAKLPEIPTKARRKRCSVV